MSAKEYEVVVHNTLIAALTLGLSMASPALQAAEAPELRPLMFLIGEWGSSGSGQPGPGAGTAVFTRSLQDQVILRTSFAEYPATGGTPPSRHDDLMVIYVSPEGVRADYYDSEGHVIRYRVRSPSPGEAVFLSDAVTGEPTYRLSYTLSSTGVLDGSFEIADPGTTEFKSYLTWHSTRVP